MTPKSLRLAVMLLSASLILNIALGAFIATRYLRDRAFDQYPQAMDSESSAALRAAFGEAMSGDRRAFQDAFASLRQARERQHEIVTAEKLDLEALDTAHTETRTAIVGFVSVLQAALRETAASLPDEERRAIPKMTAPTLKWAEDAFEQSTE